MLFVYHVCWQSATGTSCISIKEVADSISMGFYIPNMEAADPISMGFYISTMEAADPSSMGCYILTMEAADPISMGSYISTKEVADPILMGSNISCMEAANIIWMGSDISTMEATDPISMSYILCCFSWNSSQSVSAGGHLVTCSTGALVEHMMKWLSMGYPTGLLWQY